MNDPPVLEVIFEQLTPPGPLASFGESNSVLTGPPVSSDVHTI
jgi:hypothetical protein